jgi:type VI secretion system secreted protein Hcp
MYESYFSVEGEKQGKFKGSSPRKGRADWIDVIGFSMGATLPHDANNWKPKGVRNHDPVQVTIEACSASPQLLQALYTAEVLKKVIIEHVNRPKDGSKEQVTERITLVNAVCVNIKRYTSVNAKEKVEHDVDNLDDVSFAFQSITVENLLGSTSVTDDWNNNS